LHGT
jgi:hypothetical protein